VLDVQNDFADPRGSLYVRHGERVVPVINEQVEAAKTGGALVAYTQDWHPESTPHFQKDGGIWPVHCVKETWGAELHPGLRVMEGGRVRKGSGGEDGYSAFSVRDPTSGHTAPTELEAMLRERGVQAVTVCGLATDYCVRATALDAVRSGFEVVLLSDACRGVNVKPEDSDQALRELADSGVDLTETKDISHE